MHKGGKINIEELIFRYKWWIGSLLLVLIVISGGYLFLREGKLFQSSGREDYSSTIEELENRVADSELKVAQLQEAVTGISNNQAAQQSEINAAGEVAGASVNSSTSVSNIQVTGKINLNTATASQLDTLPGIGAAYAQRIIEYRQSSGGFKSIDEIKNIKGIGDKTFDKLKDLITI